MHDKEKKESVPVGKKVCKHNRQGRCMQCERELAKTEKLRQEGWENYQLAYKRVQELEEELAKMRELFECLEEDIADGTFDKNNNRAEYLELIRKALGK